MFLLWHPWLTTTNLSYSFPILKLPPPPCAVLLVISNCGRIHGKQHSQTHTIDILALQSWPSQSHFSATTDQLDIFLGSCDVQLGTCAEVWTFVQLSKLLPQRFRRLVEAKRRSLQVDHHYVLSVNICTAKQEVLLCILNHSNLQYIHVYSIYHSISTKSILKPHHTEAH